MEPNTPNRWPVYITAAIIFLLVMSSSWFGTRPPPPPVKPAATVVKAQAPVAAAKTEEIPAVCNAKNSEPFNGKVLYDCVFGLMVKSDLSLMEPTRRAAFIKKWQHKFDATTMLDNSDDTYLAIRSMVSDLGEMHTAFLAPKDAKELFQHTDGNLQGIGAPLARLGMASARKALGENPDKEALKALDKITESTPLMIFPAPEKDSPAAKAGLLGGDRIMAVDGVSNNGYTINEVVDRIKGPAGTKVVLSIKRPAAGGLEDKDITITRGDVHFTQVKTTYLGDGFVKLQILNFTNTVAEEFNNALYEACTGTVLPYDEKALVSIMQNYHPAEDCKLKGLVIDVRNDPGGVLPQVLAIGQLLMTSGPTITIQQRNGNESIEVHERIEGEKAIQEQVVDGKVVRSHSELRYFQLLPEIPIVVLTDEGSASASEILAGMLQANGLATVVGTPSFGKEVGQTVLPIDFGAAVKITTFRFLPGNKPLGVAILPDYVVKQGDAYIDDPSKGEDLQLSKAVTVLSLGKAALVEAHSPQALEAKAKLSAEVGKERTERNRKIMEALRKGLPEIAD